MMAMWVGLTPMLLIFLLGVVFLVFRAGRRGPGIRRRVRKRHIVTRIVCAALALAILVAVGVSTHLDVNALYEEELAAEAKTVRVPTGDAPPPPLLPKSPFWTPVGKERFLVRLLVVDKTTLLPVHAETFDVAWPKARARWLERRFHVAGHRASYRFILHQVWWQRPPRESRKQTRLLWAPGFATLRYRGFPSSSPRSTSSPLKSGYIGRLGREKPGPYNPLSVVRRRFPGLEVFRFVSRVTETDPLKEVPLSDFARARASEMSQWLEHERGGQRTSWRRSSKDMPLKGFAMAGHFGPVCLLLLAAAILLAQLFTHRGLLFPVVLAVIILYAASLDRMVLGRHLTELSQADAPVGTRVSACRNAENTFFYVQTAREAFGAVAEDQDAPAALRRVAKEAADK